MKPVASLLAFLAATFIVGAAHAQTPPQQRVLFITINGSYNGDGNNFCLTVQQAAGAANVTCLLLSSNGQIRDHLNAGNVYQQIWVYDLSTAADNYPADYDAIATWYSNHPSKHIICDGRIISSYWSSRYLDEGKKLSQNYYHNLALRQGGLVLSTDHDAFFVTGMNAINSRIGLNPFIGNFNLTKIPVDQQNVLMKIPNQMGPELWDDSSPGQTPYGLQPNGKVLHTLAWHSANTQTPGISTTIQGSLGVQTTIAGAVDTRYICDTPSFTLTASATNGIAPYTFQWSSNLQGNLGTGPSLTLTTANLIVGTHVFRVLTRDADSQFDDATITLTIGSAAQCTEAVGCADSTREGFVGPHIYPTIAACSGAWNVPGVFHEGPACNRGAGNNATNAAGTGCNVEDLCSQGWHVCHGPDDINPRTNARGCLDAVEPTYPNNGTNAPLVSVPPGGAFFVSRASGSGSGNCDEVVNGFPSSFNDIFGCGNLGAPPNANCAPLNRFGQNQCNGLQGTTHTGGTSAATYGYTEAQWAWSCNDGGNGTLESKFATKTRTGDQGGVLCCKDADPTLPEVCDGIDNDGDGVLDETDFDNDGAADDLPGQGCTASGTPGAIICSGSGGWQCTPLAFDMTGPSGLTAHPMVPKGTATAPVGAPVLVKVFSAEGVQIGSCAATVLGSGTWSCPANALAAFNVGHYSLVATLTVGTGTLRDEADVEIAACAPGLSPAAGCTAALPYCAPVDGYWTCVGCDDASSGGVDIGCTAAAPACDPFTRQCGPCAQGALGAACGEVTDVCEEPLLPEPDVIMSCIDKRVVGNLDPTIEWRKDSYTTFAAFNQIMMTPVAGNLTDDNADGHIDENDTPDIVFTLFSGSNYAGSGVLRVISGSNGAELFSTDGSAEGAPIYASAGVALGDLDGNGRPEIVVGGNGTYGVLAWEANVPGQTPRFTLKWRSTACGVGYAYDNPAIADVDGDGSAEVIASGPCVLSASGALVAKAATIDQSQNSPFAVDLDTDAQLEIISGARVFDLPTTGTTLASKYNIGTTSGLSSSAVGDFDGDGRPEIIVVHTNAATVTLYDPDAATDLDTKDGWVKTLPDGGSGARGGPPTVADFDGDGELEVGVAAQISYSVLDNNGSTLWTVPVQDGSSRVTGSSVFDFDGDTAAEVVYADEQTLWVFDGKTGTVRARFDDHRSGTLYEYPIILDVDNDDEAEIVLASNNYGVGLWTGITVIGSQSGTWAPARPVWNQHAYSISNVNDDLSIPAVPIKNWTKWNNFRAAAPLEGLAGWLSDVFVSSAQGCAVGCDGNEPLVRLDVVVGNRGRLAVTQLKVEIRNGSPTGPIIATIVGLGPESGASSSIPVNVPRRLWTGRAYATVTSLDSAAECSTVNNQIDVGFAPVVPDRDLDDIPDVCDPCVTQGAEICDGEDDDCNGTIDDGCDDDDDGYCDELMGCNAAGIGGTCPNGCGDCDDGVASSSPGGVEVCNGVDDDCDDLTDDGIVDAGFTLTPNLAEAEVGDYVSWVIAFENDGEVPIRDLKLVVQIPPGLTPQGGTFTSTGGGVNLQTNLATWIFPSVAVGRRVAIPFTVQVTASAAASFAPTLSATSPNLCGADVTADPVDKVSAGPRIVKWASRADTCGLVEWKVLVTNSGATVLDDLRVIDQIDPNLDVDESSITGDGFFDGESIQWVVPQLLPGTGFTFSYVAMPFAEDGTRVGGPAALFRDGQLLAEAAAATIVSSCTPNLTLTKSWGGVCAVSDIGQPFQVRLEYRNTLQQGLTNVVIRDFVPVPCAQVVQRPPGTQCSDATHLVTIPIGTVGANTSNAVTFAIDFGPQLATGRPALDRATITADGVQAVASNTVAGVALHCNDGNSCTRDSCGELTGCMNDLTPIPGALDQLCNGVDDDCDGEADDDFIGDATTCGTGVCAAVGLERCVDGAVVDSCNASPPAAASDSVCNGKDDDCDGATDENYVTSQTSCGIGECANSGQRTCQNGAAVDSCAPKAPSDEVCDGKDNDCDTKVDVADVSLVRPLCDKQAGVCAGVLKPVSLCVQGAWQACSDAVYVQAAPGYAAVDSSCNGADNDCSGVADDDFAASATSCGLGECIASGLTTCVAGQLGDTCRAGPTEPELCDGVDNDCDGATDAADPDLVLGLCLRQAGVCAGAHQTRDLCVSGEWRPCGDAIYAAHAFPQYASNDASCDGRDNDCSGASDEDFVVVQTSCGTGACAQNAGQRMCSGGVVSDTCQPLAGATPERCDDADNDCDGATDDAPAFSNKGAACDGTDLDVCLDGILRCSPDGAGLVCDDTAATGVERCDGVDNDCDGETDERCDDDQDGFCDAGLECVTGGALIAACNLGCGDCDDDDAAESPGATEVCNGKDDDCGGGVDEGCDDDDDGVCDAAMGAGCTDCDDTDAGVGPTVAERCNGRDEDCDGQTDEGFDKGEPCQVGVGACTSSGISVCDSSGTGIICDAPPRPEQVEVCNDKDDDCDGATDELFQLGAPCVSGSGECAVTGTRECAPNGEATCDATPGTPGDEVCDGLDNDCDGAVDNDPESPGVSLCPDVDTLIIEGPAALTASSDARFSIIDPITLDNQRFECSLDGGAWWDCSGGDVELDELALGSHVLLARALGDNGLYDATPALWQWTIDATVPDTLILAGPDDPSQSATALFAFGATVANPATWMCAVDPATSTPLPGDYIDCGATLTLEQVDDGMHTLWVYVIDTKGTADPTPATWSWLVDTTAPDTAIVLHPPAVGVATSATFTYEDPSDPETDTFECRIDGGDWVACSALGTTFDDLAEGEHLFAVRAVDDSGTADPSPARYEFVIDLSPPDTLVLTRPEDPSQNPNALFVFDSDEDLVTYECSLDGAAFVACDSTTLYEGLEDGEHTLLVRATDDVGHVDPTPASVSWTIDTSAPETEITAGPAALAGVGSPVVLHYRDPVTPENDVFECQLDGGAWLACDGGTMDYGSVGTSLPVGSHTFMVRACDREKPVGLQCDPVPAVWRWEITPSTCPDDVDAPVVSCSAPLLVECLGGTAVVDLDSLAPVATDACGPVTITRMTGDALVIGENPVVFTATDGNGNTAACGTTVTIVDSVGPSITCPPDVTRDNDEGVCGATVAPAVAQVADACQRAGLVTFTDAPVAFPVGETVVTHHVVDAAGNEATCERRVIVEDVEDLTLTCSASAIVDALPERCDWSGALTADAADNCAVDVSLIEQSGTYGIGETPIVFSAEDKAGNAVSCTTRLTVRDVTPPVPTCGTLVGRSPALVRGSASDACTASARIREATCFQLSQGGEVELDVCPFVVDADVLTLNGALDSGALKIVYAVEAVDPSNNRARIDCEIVVDGDRDDDGIIDDEDNCVDDPNPDQGDGDGDLVGDACDNCAATANDQSDADDDGRGDACDNCGAVANDQADLDSDGAGDACDVCVRVSDADQADADDNGVGDACQDVDLDGHIDLADNCPLIANEGQHDLDDDDVGDACDDELGPGFAAQGSGGCAAGGSFGSAGVLIALLMFALVSARRSRRDASARRGA